MCLNHYKEEDNRQPSTEVALCNSFTYLYDSERFSLCVFWHMRSTLRVRMLNARRVNTKNYVILKTLLKKFTTDHIKKNPDAFSPDNIKRGLNLFDDEVPADLKFKIGARILSI